MTDEISETAKAVQEVAKTTRVGIEATEKLGGFVARMVNEPVEAVVGILTDRLQFMRAQRQLRLASRWREIISDRKIEAPFRIVSPKLALPAIEHASLEEDDELQDLWANLLASAVDPNFDGLLRSAFIDIAKQLEVIDVHVLNLIYKFYKNNFPDASQWKYPQSPTFCPVYKRTIVENLTMEDTLYENSVDNLIRLRCIAFYVEKKSVSSGPNPLTPDYYEVSYDYSYDAVTMTSLGVSFVEACAGKSE